SAHHARSSALPGGMNWGRDFPAGDSKSPATIARPPGEGWTYRQPPNPWRPRSVQSFGQLSCHETPNLSVNQTNLRANGYSCSGMKTLPSFESMANRSSTSVPVLQVTNNDVAGVNVKSCGGLSMHVNSRPLSVNVACMTEPSAPASPLP